MLPVEPARGLIAGVAVQRQPLAPPLPGRLRKGKLECRTQDLCTDRCAADLLSRLQGGALSLSYCKSPELTCRLQARPWNSSQAEA